MNNLSFVEPKKKALSQIAYEALTDRLLSGAWKAGVLYDRRSIAKELGMSIAPVAEAMIRLEQEGFVVNFPRKGTLLRPNDERTMYENLILREALEMEAVRLVHPRLGELECDLMRLAKAADSLFEQERRAADHKFHEFLIHATGVKALALQYERISMQLSFDELHLLDIEIEPYDLHIHLVRELLLSGNATIAAERISRHIRISREIVFHKFEAH